LFFSILIKWGIIVFEFLILCYTCQLRSQWKSLLIYFKYILNSKVKEIKVKILSELTLKFTHYNKKYVLTFETKNKEVFKKNKLKLTHCTKIKNI